jgi:hypothetical protein
MAKAFSIKWDYQQGVLSLSRYRGLQRRGKGFEPSGGITHRSQHTLAAALTNGNLSIYIIAQSYLRSLDLRDSTALFLGDSWICEFGRAPRLCDGFSEKITTKLGQWKRHRDHHILQWLAKFRRVRWSIAETKVSAPASNVRVGPVRQATVSCYSTCLLGLLWRLAPGETGELLKTSSKDDRSRDFRSDRPVFKARGIDQIPVFLKIWREIGDGATTFLWGTSMDRCI